MLMKTHIKILLPLLCFLFFIQVGANAQKGWNFGLNGGLNFSWVDAEVVNGDPLPGEFGTRFSYNVGLFGEYGFNERIFFQIGFNIDQRGFSYKESSDDKSVDVTVKAPYFEIPMLFRWAFINKESFGMYALAGPSFAFLVGGRIKGERTVNGEVYTIDTKVTDAYSTTDIGLKVGLGAEIPFADDQGATFFGVNYIYGFTDHIRQAGYYETSNVDARSNVVSFVVGVRGYIE